MKIWTWSSCMIQKYKTYNPLFYKNHPSEIYSEI